MDCVARMHNAPGEMSFALARSSVEAIVGNIYRVSDTCALRSPVLRDGTGDTVGGRTKADNRPASKSC